MSEIGKKNADYHHHRLLVKPSKTSISSSTTTTTTTKHHQGLVKKEREPASPAPKTSLHSASPVKHSLPKTSLHSANNSKLVTSVGKATSSKATPKSSSKYDADKKAKKVYTLPGQKHDPPDEREPLRIFYGSLYQQNPKSEMAQFWMMEHGLLPPEAARKALERKKKSQLNQKLGLPTKASKGFIVKSEKVVTKTMVVTPARKSFTSNGDSKVLSKVKRKLDLGSDSDDDRLHKPKKKFSTSA